jgi:hypothetical protein
MPRGKTIHSTSWWCLRAGRGVLAEDSRGSCGVAVWLVVTIETAHRETVPLVGVGDLGTGASTAFGTGRRTGRSAGRKQQWRFE